MHHYYCTYFDKNYLLRGLALIASLQEKKGSDFTIYAVCLDEFTRAILNRLDIPQVKSVALHEIEQNDAALIAARGNRNTVEYYWTLTPTIILRVLERNPHIDVLTYLDSDLYFFSSPDPIYDELGDASVLIHGHRFPNIFEHLAVNGLYNVGLLCFRNDARALVVLRWWRDRCNEWCYNKLEDGKYGDQLYLNDWPERFDGVVVLQHLGAGVAPWNLIQYDIKSSPEVGTTIDGVPLVFFHFHALSILSPQVFISSKHHGYLISEAALRYCYLPYIQQLIQTMAVLRKEVPQFNGADKNVHVDTNHIIVFDQAAAPILEKVLINRNVFNLSDGWSFVSGPRLTDRSNLLARGVLKLATHGDNSKHTTESPSPNQQQISLVWERLQALGPNLRVLELGQGPWATQLAQMTQTLGGSFWSIGPQQGLAQALENQLRQSGNFHAIHIGIAPPVDTELYGEAGQFLDVSVLGDEAGFDLVWVSVEQVFHDARHATHALPAIATRMSSDGNLLLQTADAGLQHRSMALWQNLTDNQLFCEESAFQNLGLWVGLAEPRHVQPTQPLAANTDPSFKGKVGSIPHMELEGIALFTECLASAKVFLEYGSGGSSVMAATTPVQRIYSVDSDSAFLEAVTNKIKAVNAPDGKYIPIYVDVGRTADWGTPVDIGAAARWPNYPEKPWSIMEQIGEQPDLILIDGRFRVACFCISALCAPIGCTILFDDYIDRPEYHVVEKYLPVSRKAGRMAAFIVPSERPPGLILELLRHCTQSD